MQRPAENAPRVTIVVPAKNEEKFIGRCLAALRQLVYPQSLVEIVVVDNGSTDRTAEISRQAGVRVIAARGLVGAVRNAGARDSTADILAFVDGDCVVLPEWLAAGVDALRDATVGMAGGGYVPNPEGTWVERAWTDSTAAPARAVQALPGGSMIVRRDRFEAVGRFDESLSAGEDDELCSRVRRAGLSVLSLPRCYVTHLGYPATLRAVARRQIWHGASQLYVVESRADSQLLMTHGFFVGAIGLPIALVSGSNLVALTEGALVAVPVLVLAARRARRRHSKSLLFLQLLGVGFFFYLGRSIGLAKNYWSLLARLTSGRPPRA